MTENKTNLIDAFLADSQLDKDKKKALEAELLEAIRSPSVVADAAFWAERRRKILERCLKVDLSNKEN